MRLIIGSAAFIAAFFFSQIARAQDVTLISRNGGLEIEGQLIAYDGEFYRIETGYGPLTVDAEGVLCDGPACPTLTAPLATIRITGASGPANRLLPPLFAAFAADRGLIYQQTDFGFAADITDPNSNQPLARLSFTPLPADQIRAALVDGQVEMSVGYTPQPGLRSRAMALEPLIAIVSSDNAFPQIRSPDLVAALTGQVVNWQEIGGPDMPIAVHALKGENPLQKLIVARMGAEVVDGPRHDDAATLARAVARDPWALGLIGQSEKGPARELPLTDSCDFLLPATPLSVKAEDYPLTVPVFILTPGRRLPLLLREFLEFLATGAAQNAVAAAGYIDRRLGQAPLTEDGQRLLGAIRNAGEDVSLPELQRLAAAMAGGQRLSLTFRFQDGSARLDAHSRDNLDDLARYIAIGSFKGSRLVLAGFSDGSGPAEDNLALSRSRAEAVRRALQALAPEMNEDDLPEVEAFGEALPMACDTNPVGRQVNRRVELWLHPSKRP